MLADYGFRAIMSKKERIKNEYCIKKAMKSGEIFVYPTDTVYGIGCNALKVKSVAKVYSIKKRPLNKPLSVIAPSFEWILKNFFVDEKILGKYFPGPYTLILRKKKMDFLSAISSGDSVGVRIPDSSFSKLVEKAGVPFVTTSANISGAKSAGNLSEIEQEVMDSADIVIEGSNLSGKPSTIVDLATGKVTERKR